MTGMNFPLARDSGRWPAVQRYGEPRFCSAAPVLYLQEPSLILLKDFFGLLAVSMKIIYEWALPLCYRPICTDIKATFITGLCFFAVSLGYIFK